MQISDPDLQGLVERTADYIEVVLGEELEPYMVDVCDLIDKGKNKIAISACHAVGKTHGLSCIVDAIMTCTRDVKIITTAPTFRQVELLLWKEISSRFSSKPDEWQLGNLNSVKWEVDSETFAVGFSPSKEAGVGSGQSKQSPFQGFHGKNLTVVIFDEATGVPPQIWKEAEGLLTTSNTLWLCIGNPTTKNSEFYDCFTSPVWTKVSITCFDTPNFKANGIFTLDDMVAEGEYLKTLLKDEGQDAFDERLESYIVVKPFLIVVRWAMEKLLSWGIDHPLFQGKVLGKFPDDDGSSIISEATVLASMNTTWDITDEDIRYIGVDVARDGPDSTVFTEIVGWQHTRTESHRKTKTKEAVDLLIDFLIGSEHHHLEDSWPAQRKTRIAVDPGYNPGVYDGIVDILSGEQDHPHADKLRACIVFDVPFASTKFERFHFGWADDFALHEKTYVEDRRLQGDKEHFANMKSKMFDQLAKDLQGINPEQEMLCLNPKYKELYTKQLPTIVRVPGKNDSKLLIESKQAYKIRTGKNSPDESDSLALAAIARYFAVMLEEWY